jgi:hypothetical protein
MAQKQQKPKEQRPAQEQERQPGLESQMEPQPRSEDPNYHGSGGRDH